MKQIFDADDKFCDFVLFREAHTSVAIVECIRMHNGVPHWMMCPNKKAKA